jgi:hypothetical protein
MVEKMQTCKPQAVYVVDPSENNHLETSFNIDHRQSERYDLADTVQTSR